MRVPCEPTASIAGALRQCKTLVSEEQFSAGQDLGYAWRPFDTP